MDFLVLYHQTPIGENFFANVTNPFIFSFKFVDFLFMNDQRGAKFKGCSAKFAFKTFSV